MQLNDSYILDWNNGRLAKELLVMANYTNGTHISLLFSVRDIYSMGDAKQIGDPNIDFKFTFSVSKERSDYFFEIFDRLKKRPFDNKVRLSNGTFEDVSIVGLKPDITKTDHTVSEMEYTRYEYLFSGKASSIIAYTYLLETTIDFFSQIWGYDESGGEHQLLKYPIGSMVCLKKDNSIDYVVIDLDYSTRGSNNIYYTISEMKMKGTIITYGDAMNVSEKEIVWSRNGRIDDILNGN